MFCVFLFHHAHNVVFVTWLVKGKVSYHNLLLNLQFWQRDFQSGGTDNGKTAYQVKQTVTERT